MRASSVPSSSQCSESESESAPLSLPALELPGASLDEISIVYKFGGSSVANFERVVEVTDIICAFKDNAPAVVVSAMGKTTNNLLAAGELAEAMCKNKARGSVTTDDIEELEPVATIRKLHEETCHKLGLDDDVAKDVDSLLRDLVGLLVGVALLGECSVRARDSLVSYGERMSSRIVAGALEARGVPAVALDAFRIGVTTNDEFGNAVVMYEETYEALGNALARRGGRKQVPIITGFLGKGQTTGAITTLGRGGSDLSATLIGAALRLPEVQVWKDVDGILSCDPRILDDASLACPVSMLTYDEATELSFYGATVLHPASMRPALDMADKCARGEKDCRPMNVRVKNSYNRDAEGTLITNTRDLTDTLLTSIVVKRGVTVLDILSTRMVGSYGFLSKAFDIFKQQEISVDMVATSECALSVTLDPAGIWSRDLFDEELENLRLALIDEGFRRVDVSKDRAIISLVCNAGRSSELLARVGRVLSDEGIRIIMSSQGASASNISFVVVEEQATEAARVLHNEFFEK